MVCRYLSFFRSVCFLLLWSGNILVIWWTCYFAAQSAWVNQIKFGQEGHAVSVSAIIHVSNIEMVCRNTSMCGGVGVNQCWGHQRETGMDGFIRGLWKSPSFSWGTAHERCFLSRLLMWVALVCRHTHTHTNTQTHSHTFLQFPTLTNTPLPSILSLFMCICFCSLAFSLIYS